MNEKQEKAIIALNRLYSMNQIDEGEFLTLVELVMRPVQFQYIPYYWNVPYQQQDQSNPQPYEVTCTTSQYENTGTDINVNKEFLTPTNGVAKNPVLDKLLEDSELPRWVWVRLWRNEIRTVRDLVRLHKSDIIKMKNMGRKSLWKLDEFIEKLGLDWGMQIDN